MSPRQARPRAQIFLSAVTAEFGSYRDAIRRDLTRPNRSVKIQEDLIPSADTTLLALDDYIRECDAVIHIVGDATGAPAKAPAVVDILRRYPDLIDQLPALREVLAADVSVFSYTQWLDVRESSGGPAACASPPFSVDPATCDT